MKNFKFVVFTLVLLGLLVGCELAPTLTELDGSWKFPNGSSVDFVKGDSTDLMIDIWPPEGMDYSYSCVGELAGNQWIGLYDYFIGEDSLLNLTLSIHLTVKNDKLSMKCTGEGPLNGKTFTGGIKQP